MALRITVESLGLPQKDFYQVKNELLLVGKKFDKETLPSIPYSQLHLCSLSSANSTICSLRLIQEEKQSRRERFIIMDRDEILQMKNYLIIERMWDDVVQERAYRVLPHWNNMNERQRVWLKLNCVFNHVDDPNQRGGEIISGLIKCGVTRLLPPEVVFSFSTKLKDLLKLYPVKIADNTLRDRISVLSDGILQFLPEEERQLIENEEIQEYSCTSDCYRVLLV
jgi:hypothetical protein